MTRALITLLLCLANCTRNDPVSQGDPNGAAGDDMAGGDSDDGDTFVTATYEGFGAVTEGADSCPTTPAELHVTSLADSGSGTLRDALSSGCRKVVFEVGGTITLASDMDIRHSYITIAGETAPPPGITIVQPGDIGTVIEARSGIGPVTDVIIRYLRHDGQAVAHTNVGDIWGIDGESASVSNVVIDHVTAIAATDGAFDIWADVHDVTLSWNLITDTVTALHLSEATTVRNNISVHHNVFARNNERQIKVKFDCSVDFVNNVVYGWGWMECAGRGLNIDFDHTVDPTINVINNVFHDVAGTPCGGQNGAIIYTGAGANGSQVFFQGNILPAGEADATSTVGAPWPIPVTAQVTTFAADTLADTVVPLVGTHYPTATETTLLGQVGTAIRP